MAVGGWRGVNTALKVLPHETLAAFFEALEFFAELASHTPSPVSADKDAENQMACTSSRRIWVADVFWK